MERPYRSKVATKKSYFSQAATFSLPRPAISPGSRSDKSFSGPLVSIIPKDARHRKKSDVVTTSPKISCMGRIKHKKEPVAPAAASASASSRKEKAPARRRLFGFGACGFPCCRARGSRETDRKAATEKEAEKKKKAPRRPAAVAAAPVPGLGQMRRYASGRETLAGFDWRKEMAGKNGGYGDSEEEEDDDEVLVPHSAPILVCGGEVVVEPKKEVNLWRRRSMPPPPPLRLEKK